MRLPLVAVTSSKMSPQSHSRRLSALATEDIRENLKISIQIGVKKSKLAIFCSICSIENDCYRDGWLCNGEVISQASRFIHGPPPFLVVDIVHRSMNDPDNDAIRQIDLNFHDIQRVIKVGPST